MHNKCNNLFFILFAMFIGLIIVCSIFEQELIQVFAPVVIFFVVAACTLYKIVLDIKTKNNTRGKKEEI